MNFHNNGSRIFMSSLISFSCCKELPNGHLIIIFMLFLYRFRRLPIRNKLILKTHRAANSIFTKIINSTVFHKPFTIFPNGIWRIFHADNSFILEFLNRYIFQFFIFRIISPRIKQMGNFSILYITKNNMIRNPRIQITFNFNIDNLFIFPIRPWHHILIKSHRT